jgi:hypothetical protein
LNGGLGLRLPLGPLSATAGAELPIVGDAFTWRGYVRAMIAF